MEKKRGRRWRVDGKIQLRRELDYILMEDTYLWYTRQNEGRSSLQIKLSKKAFPIVNFPTYGLWRHSVHPELRRSLAVTNPP